MNTEHQLRNRMKTESDVTVLFVDDEPDLLSSLRRFLRREPYKMLFANSGREALQVMGDQPVDIIVSDLRMPEMDGLTLLAKVKQAYPEIIRIILSATREVEQTIEAINTGEVYRFISKPMNPAQLKQTLQDVVNYHLLIIGHQEMTTEIEKRLLEDSPPGNLAGTTISSLMIPAGDLSGDFTDYFYYNDQKLDILVGDVMGKGIQSALVAASIKHQFAKSLAIWNSYSKSIMHDPGVPAEGMMDLSQVVSCVHSMCIDSLLDLEIFATLDYARIDLEASRLSLVDCGHTPVIHFQKKSGACKYIKSRNMPLGLIKNQDYQVVTSDLDPGDIILFYSDGIIETQDASGELYGLDRLVRKVEEGSQLSPGNLIDSIRDDLSSFNVLDRFADDLTCVAIRIEDPQ